MKFVLPWITRAGAVLILGTCLFAEALMRVSSGHVASILREVQAVFRDASLRWMIMACLVMYYVTFLVLNRRNSKSCSSRREDQISPSSRPNEEKWSDIRASSRKCCPSQDSAPSSPSPFPSPQGEETAAAAHPGWSAGSIAHASPSPFPSPQGEGTAAAAHPGGSAGSIARASPSPRGEGRGEGEFAFNPENAVHPRFGARPAVASLSALFVFLALIRYILDYRETVFSLDALTLIGTIVLGQGVAFWIAQERQSRGSDPRTFIAFTLILLLCFAALWHPQTLGAEFAYLGRPRWTGPWINPNTFGTLMAVGVVLACGMLVMCWRRRQSWPGRLGIAAALCVLALLGNALARSLSRGSWVAAAAGLAFMGWCILNRSERIEQSESQSSSSLRFLRLLFKKLLFPSAIILLSLFVLVTLNFRGSDHVLLRRVASIANPNDFSWRNRVASWEGALQMMADKPLLGHGWGATENRYEAFYKPAKLDTGAAIQMNDYLIIGASLGLPAFAALVGLIFSLVRAGLRHNNLGPEPPLQLALTAAATALAVAFWFDGGLFKLSLAAVFWTALAGFPHDKGQAGD